jgi:hypothetical protein
MRTIFGFFILYLAEDLHFFEKIGAGFFKNISVEEEIAEVDAMVTEVDENDSGTIYAYSFPSLIKGTEKFPIKVGLTTGSDPEARVRLQCRQTCCFEHPVVLGEWAVIRVSSVERSIHSTLEARGSKRDAPGTEWFDTTLPEIESIIRFVQPNVRSF